MPFPPSYFSVVTETQSLASATDCSATFLLLTKQAATEGTIFDRKDRP